MIVSSWNAHSLDIAKREEFFDSMENNNIAIAGIAETWKLYGYDQQYDCTISGMTAFGYQHPTGRRGLACFAQKSTTVKFHKPYCIQEQHYTMITTQVINIVVVFVYLPNGNRASHIDGLIDKIDLLQQLYPNVCVLGDFNARMSILPDEPTNQAGRRLSTYIDNSRFTRIPIDQPTFPSTPSCIDHAIVTCPHLITDYGLLSSTFASDHHPIWISINVDINLEVFRPVVSWSRMSRLIERDLPNWCNDLDADFQLDQFSDLIADTQQKCTRLRKQTSDLRAYIDRDLRKLITKRNHAAGPERARLTKQVQTEFRRRKRRAHIQFCQDGVSSKSSAKQWKTLKLMQGPAKPPTPPPEPEECKQIVSMFREFHVIREDLRPSITHQDISQILYTDQPNNPYDFVGVTDIEIKKLLKHLRKKASMGRDGISLFLLKDAGPRLTQWIVDCCNQSLRSGHVPHQWKEANIIALPKPSGGYRPISLLSNLGKLVERVVLRRLKEHCFLNNIIPENQYANKGGTGSAITQLVDYVSSNRTKPTYVVFFDVRKAFDRVHVPTLMSLLIESKLPQYLICWIYSYLTNRHAYVGEEKYELTNGVPQGSVLGPVLFQIYIAPVLKELKNVYTAYYADDLCIACGGVSNPTIGAFMQRALNKIHDSCCRLGVELDPRKTKVMWLRKASTSVSYPKLHFHLGPKQLEYTKSYKYLGFWLDNRLTFSKHIQTRLRGAKKRNGAVFRLPGVVKKKLRPFWRGYVEPYLMYGIPEIYHLICDSAKNQLKAFYARSARLIAGLLPHCPADIAIKVSGLQPFEELIETRRMEKKLRKKFRKKCVDLKQTPESRRCEVNFERWRSGWLYTNHWKKTHHFDKCNGLCRFCKRSDETRQHIIFECKEIDTEARTLYLSKVSSILKLETAPDDLDTVLGLSYCPTASVYRELAWALLEFCQTCEYWA